MSEPAPLDGNQDTRRVPPLRLRQWQIDDVVEGAGTAVDAGTLIIDRIGLEGALSDRYPAVGSVGIDLVKPGDPVRVNGVLDAVAPSYKPNAHREKRGTGITHRLNGVNLLSVCRIEPDPGRESPDGDSILDFGGPAARYSPFSAQNAVIVTFSPPKRVTTSAAALDTEVRDATHWLANELAAVVEGTPDTEAVYRLEKAPGKRSRIGVVIETGSEGPLLDTYLEGTPLSEVAPTVIDPRAIIDGALTNGAYDYAGLRHPTALYQRSTLLQTLLEGHGDRFDFAGTVLALAYLNNLDDKRRAADRAAELVEDMHADVVIVASFQSGNSHSDTILVIDACAARAIPAVGIIAETGRGLLDHSEAARSLISAGDEDALVPGWGPDAIFGERLLLDGTPADTARPFPIVDRGASRLPRRGIAGCAGMRPCLRGGPVWICMRSPGQSSGNGGYPGGGWYGARQSRSVGV
jgi:hypothetical protein